MAQNTLGRRIRERESEVKIHGEWFRLKARVEAINAFSAHADYMELTDWIDSIDTTRLKKIFMVHGEPSAQSSFKVFLSDRGTRCGYRQIRKDIRGRLIGLFERLPCH
jgi:metallo-beta-lactamase family protein